MGSDGKLAVVLRDGPAGRAGLSAHDTLVAIDGLRATPEHLANVLARRTPGETVEVHAFRRDELMRFAVTLAAPPLDTCYCTIPDEVAPEVAARRQGWLGT